MINCDNCPLRVDCLSSKVDPGLCAQILTSARRALEKLFEGPVPLSIIDVRVEATHTNEEADEMSIYFVGEEFGLTSSNRFISMDPRMYYSHTIHDLDGKTRQKHSDKGYFK
jgi:hypothetical protein